MGLIGSCKAVKNSAQECKKNQTRNQFGVSPVYSLPIAAAAVSNAAGSDIDQIMEQSMKPWHG
jgi:hypothetical protein